MDNRYLIEECPALTIGSIKRDLVRCRRREANITGIINIVHGKAKLEGTFWFEYDNDSTFFVVCVDGLDPQRILLVEQVLYFGDRSYFVCDCGVRCNKLYLPPGKDEFKCRRCYRLRYELQTINRNSAHGRIFYKTNRKIKLMNQQSSMSRIIYKGKYTKKYNRFLNLCRKAGLNNVVNNARDLMVATKA